MKKEIIRDSIKRQGIAKQHDYMLEECGELIVALQHLKRGRHSVLPVIEELADVSLMTDVLLQWEEDYGYRNAKGLFKETKRRKLIRIKELGAKNNVELLNKVQNEKTKIHK
jgi:NTP pyrophosphatase (non-canonical NTP hydrolase)